MTGQQVSKTTYKDLYDAIGDLWSNGKTPDTDKFFLPNFNNRFLEGTTSNTNIGKYKSAGLPNITGTLDGLYTSYYGDSIEDTTTGAFIRTSAKGNATNIPNYDDYGLGFDASKGTVDVDGMYMEQEKSPYGKSETVQPAAGVVIYLIKY